MLQLKFGYPRRGLAGDFATFRLGKGWSEKCVVGSRLELIDARTLKSLTHATVVSVHVGSLTDMAKLHAHQAHNWKDHPKDEQSALLVASMMRRYPPGRVLNNSVVTVIYLREVDDDSRTHENL